MRVVGGEQPAVARRDGLRERPGPHDGPGLGRHGLEHEPAPAPAGVTGGWVGASDRVAEDAWRWVGAGGVDLLADECFFGAGGPANSAVLDCVASFATNFCGDYTLFLCSDSHPYVCERDGVAIDRSAF